jgi:hypothetical protein
MPFHNLIVLAALVVGGTTLAQDSSGVTIPLEADPPCAFRDRPCGGPHLVFGAELGGGAFVEGGPFGFGSGTGSGTSPGPSWGFRVGVELTRWLAFDAHYAGIMNVINHDYAPAGSARMFTNGAALEARLTAPFPYVQPYIFGGVGIYNTSISGSAEAREGTAFNSSTTPGFPMGFGVGVPICEHISIGAEATFHFYYGEKFSEDEAIEGGDTTTFNAMFRYRL